MKPIVLMRPYIPPGTAEAVTAVLNSRWIGQGPRVEDFENAFGARLGREAVAVGSGTDALHLAYILAGIKEGTEVVVPLFTCTATTIPLLYQKARIRFADVMPGSLNSGYPEIVKACTKKTKAVVVVHYGGEEIWGLPLLRKWCVERGIWLIEDCAQCFPSKLFRMGMSGDFAAWSFQAVKHITTGDGGMLTMDHDGSRSPRSDSELATARRLRWFGIDRVAKLKGVWENDIREIGYKYQMTDIAAAMGLCGLDHAEVQFDLRRQLATRYYYRLKDVNGIQVVSTVGSGAQAAGSCHWLMTVQVDRREDLMAKLADNGIESGLCHYRNDRYTIFAEFEGKKRFPNMDAIDARYLVLPLHSGMELSDVDRICDVIRKGW